MTPDRRPPIEPSPRFTDGPPAFVPPPLATARAAGTGASAPPPPPPAPPRPPRRAPASGATPRAGRAALLAAAVALAFYIWGAAPTVLSGDSAELAAVAVSGGVPHPTGYPTFVLLGQVAARVLPGDPAHRITLMCAFAGAASVALFALLLAELGIAWGAVLAGALFFAGTFTLWWSAIRAEVYAPAIMLALFALWRVFVARRTLAARDGLAAAFAIGLAMTGHLSFGPAMALAGLALAVRAARAGRLSFALVVGALLMLSLGLTPYIYLMYADQHFTLTNYLHMTLEPAGRQFGLTPELLDTPLERLRFLVFGAESYPHDFTVHLRTGLVNMGVAWARLATFEVGPLGILLALVGEGALAHGDRGGARLLAAIALFTPLLGAALVDGALLQVFMMASVVAISALAACGMAALLERGGTRATLAVALAIAAILVPHELRVRADQRPFGANWMRMEQEGAPHIRTFVPQLRHERAARLRAERTLAAIPESSFVAAKWEVVMPMKYLQSAEGVRPDLVLDPWYEPAHVVRVARWQQQYPLATHPVVVVDDLPGLIGRLVAPKQLTLADGTTLHIERRAVRTELR